MGEEEEEEEEEEPTTTTTEASSPTREEGGGGGSSSEAFALKMLVDSRNAGAVLGKGGATINELQASTNCRIQLTRTGEVFPGTTERVLTLSGELPSVLTALHLICTKLQTET